ncbi:unnamed protein product, partial [Medioppia subpectinata]
NDKIEKDSTIITHWPSITTTTTGASIINTSRNRSIGARFICELQGINGFTHGIDGKSSSDKSGRFLSFGSFEIRFHKMIHNGNGNHGIDASDRHVAAPALKTLPEGVFLGSGFKKLQTIRIMHTGLEMMALDHMESDAILQIVDLDNNRIRNLIPNSIKVRASLIIVTIQMSIYSSYTASKVGTSGWIGVKPSCDMNMDYNAIECVYNEAFNGSQIAKLYES